MALPAPDAAGAGAAAGAAAGSLYRSRYRVFEFNIVVDAVDCDAGVLAFYRIDGYIVILAVDLELVFFHFLGDFLKLSFLLFQSEPFLLMVMKPGSRSCTVSLR